MDSRNGGLSSDERQRMTAAEIARKKVLSAYSSSTTFSSQVPVDNTQATAYKETTINNSSLQNQDLQKYHSAWQNYYQKYYSDYYSKAAKNYIETERLKREREKNDNLRLNATQMDPDSTDNQTVENTLRATIQKKADSRFHIKKHRKLIPVFAGVFVSLFILFLQYNRMIFAPIMAYIAPGNVDNGSISAIDPTIATPISDQNKLMIPKLNIDVPVHFGISNDTNTINNAMNSGVAHFMIPGAESFPGQIGNTVITGHSAGDIYSNNQYKFIFSGLERLVAGDLIYVDYNKTRYIYKMTESKTVEPTDTDSIVYNGNKPILTLITCWPLGTSRYRLLIFADQISPSIENATEVPEESKVKTKAEEMPKNEKTFFENIWSFLTGN